MVTRTLPRQKRTRRSPKFTTYHTATLQRVVCRLHMQNRFGVQKQRAAWNTPWPEAAAGRTQETTSQGKAQPETASFVFSTELCAKYQQEGMLFDEHAATDAAARLGGVPALDVGNFVTRACSRKVKRMYNTCVRGELVPMPPEASVVYSSGMHTNIDLSSYEGCCCTQSPSR